MENQESTENAKKREIFKNRFVEVISEMGDTAGKDGETLWLIGSLASQLVSKSNTSDWTNLKRTMPQKNYNELLDSFRKQGNEQASKGNKKAAFAIEVLALSVIARQMRDDEHIAAGDDLLNKMVQDSIGFFQKQSAAGQNPNLNRPN